MQQRRLATAGGSDDTEKFLIAHLKIDTANRPRRALSGNELFGNPVNDDFHFKHLGELAAKNAKHT